VLENSDGVTDDDRSRLDELTKTLEDDDLLAADPSPAIPSDDGEALQLILPVSQATTSDDVESIRDAIGKVFPTATAADMTPDQAAEAPTTVADVHVTGPAGFSADLSEAFAGIDGILLLVALIAVFVILVIVYRSPLLPVIVLFTSVAALAASIFIVWHLADAGILLINGQVQGILFILVVGATTDYSLLVVARFRDALLHESDRVRAGTERRQGRSRTDRGLRRHRHRRAPRPPAHRPRLDQSARPRRRDRHRRGDARGPDLPARRADDHRPSRVLALPPARPG
jgi:RND superfamily putative drug exporter